MKQLSGIIIISIVLVCGIVSCKKDQVTEPDMGYNYFPNGVGKYVIYDVDSFYYHSAAIIDTFKFQLKEKIQSVYSDNEGRPTLRLERYVKYYNDTVSYSAMPWIFRNVWAENRTATTAEKVEENIRYIKLNFAVKKGKSWNGNVQNTNGEMDYKYSFVDLSKNIAGNTFDSTLEVEQQSNLDLVEQQYYIEQYAKNVGLVYKRVIDVNSQPGSLTGAALTAFLNTPILQRVTSGVQYTWTVNSFGTE
jgi:hypothetical protein